jgi:hypothetical protein
VIVTSEVPATRATLEAFAEGLVRESLAIMRRRRAEGRPLPRLYESGVRYRREDIDPDTGRIAEEWQNAEETEQLGHGDCEDLATYYAAELRDQGEADARAIATKTGPSTWHMRTQRGRRGGYRIEDPSRVLGMGSHMSGLDEILRATAPVRQPMGRPGFGRASIDKLYRDAAAARARAGQVTYDVREIPNGYIAIIQFPIASGMGAVGEPGAVIMGGDNPRQALARAAVLADQITNSPIFAAVAPPGTAAAIKAIKALAKSTDARRLLRRFAGPGAERLARTLHRFW